MKRVILISILLFTLLFSAGAIEGSSERYSILESEIENSVSSIDFDDFLKTDSPIFPQSVNTKEALVKIIKGDGGDDAGGFIERLFKYFILDISQSLKWATVILALILCAAVIKASESAFSQNENIRLASYLAILSVGGMALKSFYEMGQLCINSISDNILFIESMMPVATTMLVSSGAPVSSLKYAALFLFLISLSARIIKLLFIPLTSAYIALSAAGHMLDEKGLISLSNLFSGITLWGLGISTTVFTSIMTIFGSSTSIADGAVTKGLKYAVSSLIPIVGKIISDASDAIFLSASVVKNAVGILGIIIILGQILIPIIKMIVYSLVYKALSSACDLCSLSETSGFLNACAKGFSMLCAMSACVGVIAIAGLSLLISKGAGL